MSYSALDTMTCDLVKATLNENLESAYLKMKNNKIRHLPVVDDTNKIVGIISDRDVYRGMQIENGDFDPADKVKDFMSWPIKAVTHDTDLRVVIRRMVKEKISAFLVTYEGRVTGIVTSEDLLKLLFELLEDKFFKEVPVQQKEKSWIGSLMRTVV
jgi:acetoin utilization protein AcuB